MTALDDAFASARAYMKAAEDVLAAYRELSPQHMADLVTNFPTLRRALAVLSNAHDPLDAPPK